METLYFKKTRELRKEKTELEKKLKVKIMITGKKVSFEGETVDEYEAAHVLEAMQFGFSAKKALQLTEPDTLFRRLNIKDFTRRKDMYEVRSRIIGKEAKTKRTVETISGCSVIVTDSNEVGILGPTESMDAAVVALKNIIKGSKQANAYAFLERMNAVDKTEDLGLREEEKETEDEGDEEEDETN